MGMRPLHESHPVTQRFQQNLTRFNVGAAHGAVDIGAPVGAKLVAPEDGVVVFDGWAWDLPGGPNDWHLRWYLIKPARGDTKSGGGIITIIRNASGSHWGFAHASESFLHVGDRVRAGQVLQDVGSTGSSTGSHSHVNLWPAAPVWSNGFFGAIDPEPYIQGRYAPLTGTEERKTTEEGFLHGIDVSGYQPADIVRRVAADMVIVKATEGAGWRSDRWERQLADARALGKKVGVYHFARPMANDSDREADWFYNVVRKADGRDLVWFLDWEEEGAYQHTVWARDFMARLDRLTGKQTGLYANTQALTTGTWSAADRARPLWRAYPVLAGTGYATSFNLPAAPTGWSRLVLDQYSFHGRLPGYGADLDLNVYYGGIPSWGAVGAASIEKGWDEVATKKEIQDAVRDVVRTVVREEIAKNNEEIAAAVLSTRVPNKGDVPVGTNGSKGSTTLGNELAFAYHHALRARRVEDNLATLAVAITAPAATAAITDQKEA